MDFPGGSDGKEAACNVGGPVLIPESGRASEEGNGNPFQYSCLKTPKDRGEDSKSKRFMILDYDI